MSRRAVFLDRDGTLNVAAGEHEYVTSVAEFVWMEGAREAIKCFVDLGYLVAVVSNQRGVGRGLMETSAIDEIEQAMRVDVAMFGCSIAAFRYCFHVHEDACACRKPAPGMLLGLADELDIDLSASWMVGDAETDVEAGRAAGCSTALISKQAVGTAADMVITSLGDFARTLKAAPDRSLSTR